MSTAIKEDVWIPSVCNMCFNGCAIRVHKVDGTVVKIEGNPDSPVGGGRVCGKGASGIMQLYNPNRRTKPMKRTNPKKGFDEDPGWQEISWEEAYSLAAEKMQKVMDKDPRLIQGYGMVANNANLMPYIMFLTAVGAKFWCSDICGAAIHPIYDRFNGNGNAAPDYDLCKYVLQFGTQAGTATRHGFNMSVNRFANAREKGCKLVNVDPYMAAGPQNADEWVPIRPGTDGALAMAIGYVLVHELDLYDKEYLRKYTNACDLVDVETGLFFREAKTQKPMIWDEGDNSAKIFNDVKIKQKALTGSYTVNGKAVKPSFQLYLDYVKEYTPEFAEKVTTVPAKKIRHIAKEFGEAAGIGQTITLDGHVMPYRPAAADCFSGVTRHKHAHLSVWAVLFLNLLVGSHNVPGGLISFAAIGKGNPETGLPNYNPGTYEPDHMLEATQLFYNLAAHSSYAQAHNPVKLEEDFDLGLFSLQPLNLGGDAHFIYPTQLNPEPYKQKRAELLFCYAGNIVKNWGNHDEMADFLRTFDYIIDVDIFLSDTSYFADLFLPEAQYLERYDAPPNATFNHHTVGNLQTPWAVSIRQPVVPAKDNAPGGMTIFLELANRLGKTAHLNGGWNYMFSITPENAMDYTTKYSIEEVLDRVYKSWCGPDKGVEWFKKNGVHTWPRRIEEVYIYPFRDDRIPLYLEAPVILKPQLEAELQKHGLDWEQLEDYQPLPGWRPCHEFEVSKPGYDLFPVYYTNALNVDTWGQTNPWVHEINESEPYGYTIEINRDTAEARGFKSGDKVILQTTKGYEVEGRLVLVEGIHPEVLAASSGCWDVKSKYLPNVRGKGVAINNLIPVGDNHYYDHLSAAYDQCVRVKVIRKED